MALLTRTLNLLKFNGVIKQAAKCLSTKTIASNNIPKPPPLTATHSISNHWLYKEQAEIQNPLISNSISFPNGLLWVPPEEDVYEPVNIIEAPGTENVVEKQAARLIVIRRKKMKKHKLRKLRKRMKFEWAKVRQRRELKKEKDFQAGLIAKCKEAEGFDAEKYVQERLAKLHEVIIPKYWEGKRLPEFLIREKMGLPPKK